MSQHPTERHWQSKLWFNHKTRGSCAGGNKIHHLFRPPTDRAPTHSGGGVVGSSGKNQTIKCLVLALLSSSLTRLTGRVNHEILSASFADVLALYNREKMAMALHGEKKSIPKSNFYFISEKERNAAFLSERLADERENYRSFQAIIPSGVCVCVCVCGEKRDKLVVKYAAPRNPSKRSTTDGTSPPTPSFIWLSRNVWVTNGVISSPSNECWRVPLVPDRQLTHRSSTSLIPAYNKYQSMIIFSRKWHHFYFASILFVFELKILFSSLFILCR